MTNFIYLISGLLFGLGLALSGMIDPKIIQGFLGVGFADWNPALLFVLGSAVPIYGVAFMYLRRRRRSLNNRDFPVPATRPIDLRLVVGAAIFGLGWGLTGICPGPALVHLAFPDLGILSFLMMMFVGFYLERRLA